MAGGYTVKEKWLTVLSRYKFPAIMLLLGVVLMLLPAGKKTTAASEETPPQEFDLAAMERQIEEIVGCTVNHFSFTVYPPAKSAVPVEYPGQF